MSDERSKFVWCRLILCKLLEKTKYPCLGIARTCAILVDEKHNATPPHPCDHSRLLSLYHFLLKPQSIASYFGRCFCPRNIQFLILSLPFKLCSKTQPILFFLKTDHFFNLYGFNFPKSVLTELKLSVNNISQFVAREFIFLCSKKII
jgi:hypothetical protein